MHFNISLKKTVIDFKEKSEIYMCIFQNQCKILDNTTQFPSKLSKSADHLLLDIRFTSNKILKYFSI